VLADKEKITLAPFLHKGNGILCYILFNKIIKLAHSQTLCGPVALARIDRTKSVCSNALSPDVPFFLALGDKMGARSLFSGHPETRLLADFYGLYKPRQSDAKDNLTASDSQMRLSAWAGSPAKRIFDVICVLCSLPLVLPVVLLVWLAVRLTSQGPVLFRQVRMGRDGRAFTILKFRTMPVCADSASRPTLTSSSNQQFTSIGPFLRRWKLDEVPQLIHILRGEMSLVGPRPKLACYESVRLVCRPGLTGFATMIFAREEMALAKVPQAQVDAYYQAVVKPFKCWLDTEYMAQATFLSDLKIILKSVFRDWDDLAISELPPWLPQADELIHSWHAEQGLPVGDEVPELQRGPVFAAVSQ
jgi:lipopolysaccharide/colanic/teichoic acid biosynthesis glycosyltransferase